MPREKIVQIVKGADGVRHLVERPSMTHQEKLTFIRAKCIEAKKIRHKFTLTCNFCKSNAVAIITKSDDDGYCDTCTSPYAVATIKCVDCGQAISIRS